MTMKFKKIICVILAVILTLSATAFNTVAVAANASYPNGVTENQVSNALKGTESLVSFVLKNFLHSDLKSLIEPEIYSDKVVSDLMLSIYLPMEETAGDLKALGIDVTISGVAKHLKKYPDAQNALAQANSFEELDLSTVKWGVSDKKSFSKAVSAILSPFNNLLFMLLCSGKFTIPNITKIEGGNGYENAIVPMLNALGCKNLLSQEEFKNQAKEDKSSMIYNILMSALSVVDELEKKPIDTLVTVLPGFAYFCESGQMNECFNKLLAPVKENAYIRLAILLELIDLDSMTIDVEVMLNDVLKQMGQESGLQFTALDFEKLSLCGSVNGNAFRPNKPLAYVTIMSWLIDTLKLNKNALPELLSQGDTGSEATSLLSDEALNDLLSTNTDNILKTIIMLFNDSTIKDAALYKYPELTFSTITYTENLTEEDFTKVLEDVDGLIDEFVQEYTDYKKLETLLGDTIYTSENINSAVTGIYTLLEKEGLSEMLSFMGIDISPKGVASTLTESSYSSAKNTLIKASSWANVNLSGINWGFTNGDRNGFENAFVAVLRPLYPLLEVMLQGKNMKIMNSIVINGADGYNTAVIPVLEVLGCAPDDIKTYAQYSADDSKDAVLKNITTPIFNLLDTLFSQPVNTALEILPNILYFIDSGNLEVCITNLLLPVTALTEKIAPVYKVEFDVASLTSSLNIADILKSLEGGLGLKLKDADLKVLYSYGKTETRKSKQIIDGKNTTYTYIVADKEALVLTVFRYLVDTLKLPENKGVLDGMMSSGGADSFALYASQIFEQFEGMTTDQIIEWLYNLLFKERQIVPLEDGESYNPTIIYEEEPKDYTVLYIVGGVALIGVIVGIVLYLNRKKLYY